MLLTCTLFYGLFNMLIFPTHLQYTLNDAFRQFIHSLYYKINWIFIEISVLWIIFFCSLAVTHSLKIELPTVCDWADSQYGCQMYIPDTSNTITFTSSLTFWDNFHGGRCSLITKFCVFVVHPISIFSMFLGTCNINHWEHKEVI